jgi:membrane-associated protease RseP (regulator of RpoE activity)
MTQTELPPTPEAPIEAEGDIPGKIGLAALVLGAVALGVYGGWPILVVVLALVFMIFMHELGHYLTAKSAGMKVTEFFIGFGPRIWSFQRGETEYGIKAIPAGAYVKIIGMNNLEEVDPAEESRTYRQKSYPRRMSVAVAGSAMHFLMAIVLAFVTLVGYGVYNDESARNWTVGTLSTPADVAEQFRGLDLDEDFQAQLADGLTPATAAGLEEGDRVLAANGDEIEEFVDLRNFIQDHPGEAVTFTVERDGETFDTQTTIGAVTDGERSMGFLGLGQDEPRQRLGVLEGAGEAVTSVGGLMGDSVQAIGTFFTPSGISSFAEGVFNPGSDDPGDARLDDDGVTSSSAEGDEGRIISIVGAARIGAQATDADGLSALLQIMVVLNVFIGLFNLIPLLPFDGGHVAIGTYERIREIGTKTRYQADLTKMLPVAYAVVLFMVTIGAMALYADIADPINFPG